MSIKKDRKGRLWLGTLTGGLIQFDAGTGVSVNQYEVGDGLSHDTVWSIQIDDDGRLWLGTHNGLTRFDPDANTFRVYEESDGLPSNQIVWEAASHQTAEGEMLFGGIDGFVSFFPDQVIDNPDSPPVLLKSFEPVAGVHEPRPRWLDDTNEVTVRYGDRSFSIDFVALNYRVSEKNLYRYRLAPLEAAWREASTSRRASYVNVPPGRYTFLVQGSNNDGVWNEEGDQVRITVVPPWWRAWSRSSVG